MVIAVQVLGCFFLEGVSRDGVFWLEVGLHVGWLCAGHFVLMVLGDSALAC